MATKTYNDVKAQLNTLPKVREHLNSVSVQLGKQILKQRINLGLTQTQVVKLSKKYKKPITQAQLSRIENGDPRIGLHIYEKVLYVLGSSEIRIEFDSPPAKEELVKL